MTPNGLPPGTLLGAFEIVSMLGRGGMGAVYAARNRITGDVRALKVILPELVARPEFSERFVREIRMAMAVEHPHLVRVFEPGMHGDVIFLPMELLQGEPLSAFLRRQRLVSIEATNNMIQSVGSALVALHARGILHRDVKPSNIFLAQDRGMVVPKLLDLGAGKDVDGTEENTSTGLAIGSPHYMAPEQAAGRRDLDGRVDIYSLGTVAYQLLTGARPYEHDDTGHVLAKVLSGAPYKSPSQILASIPPGLNAVVLRAMARTREERYSSVQEFLPMAMHMASMEAVGRAPMFAPVDPSTAPGHRVSAGVDPSGTVQTGVNATRRPGPSLGLVGAFSGLATLLVLAGVVWAVRPRPAPPPPATVFASAPPAAVVAPAPPTPAAASSPAAAPPPPPPSEPVASAAPAASASAAAMAAAAPEAIDSPPPAGGRPPVSPAVAAPGAAARGVSATAASHPGRGGRASAAARGARRAAEPASPRRRRGPRSSPPTSSPTRSDPRRA